MREWERMDAARALRELETTKGGLSDEEAARRLGEIGENCLQEECLRPVWLVFLGQFCDLLVVILIVAAVISMVTGDAESTAVILAVLILNAALGTAQHVKAQKSLRSLRRLSAPTARLMRAGRLVETRAAAVVPGDILLLEAGDLVVADARLIECQRLLADESSLTGEAETVEKQAETLPEAVALAERSNMIFSGSLIVGGRGMAVVTGTGMETEIGRIAALMLGEEEKRTPLQQSLDRFSGHLAAGILAICVLVFLLGIYRGEALLDSVMFSVALAVAAIPEALGSIVTIVQAMGMQRMAREQAVIKDLDAVESLGCVSVICTDKTGTLTQNRMSVRQIYADGRLYQPEQLSVGDPVQEMLVIVAVLDNDACPGERVASSERISGGSAVGISVRMPERTAGTVGDPTELALLQMAECCGVDVEQLRRTQPRLGELPFDSNRKRMSVIQVFRGQRLLLVKGAVDVLLPRSETVLTAAGVRTLETAGRRQIEEQNRIWSEDGLRVLALAYRVLEKGELSDESETRLIFVGMAALMDPPRAESLPAVLAARRAGMRPVMITGDHRSTAVAVARRTGIYRDGDLAVDGAWLDRMTEKDLAVALPRISVFARVTPEHKLRIVRAWQSLGAIVAMTGDGVNDAPALRRADVGVAMGRSGTEVARDAASMILMDDNFATIIKAVANGRNVYRNIRHAIQFLLSGNIAGILCVLYTTLLALPLPFAPVHLLFINLLTDSLPAIAIGMEPQEEELLSGPPRDPREGILTAGFLMRILMQGGLIAVGTLAAYRIGLVRGGAGTASTMAFLTLTLARLLHGFNCRSERSIIRLGLFGNLWSVMAFEIGVILLAAILFLPGLQVLFAVADLSLRQLAVVAVAALMPTILIQAARTLREAAR